MSNIPFPISETIESDVVIYTCTKCGRKLLIAYPDVIPEPHWHDHEARKRIKSTYHRTDVLISREIV